MKIALVDDEPLTLTFLENILDWNSLGLEICGTARNGRDAMKLIRDEDPHIVITDIRMPLMDGISLIDEVRKYDGRSRIIVLSAYSDFEYARKVFSSGISGYLVKPVNEEKLLGLIKEILDGIERDRIEEEKTIFSQNLAAETLLWEQISRPAADGLFYEKFGKLDKIPDFSRYQLLSLSLPARSPSRDELVQVLIETELFNSGNRLYLLRPEERVWLVLMEKVIGTVEVTALRRELQNKLDETASLTVSGIHSSPSRLSTAYEEVCYLNSLRYYATDTSYVFYRMRIFKDGSEEVLLNEAAERYFSLIKEKDMNTLKDYIGELNEKLIRKFESDIRGYQNFWTLFVILIRNWLYKQKSPTRIPPKLKEFSSGTFSEFRSSSGILAFLEELTGDIIKSPASVSGDASFSPIRDVKDFIHSHYKEKLTLEEIAGHFAMSKNYLCRIFKESAGCTLWDYLTLVRIEQAKVLLESTGIGTGEIALSVGYDNQGYFSSVFKKKTGISPKQYRDGFRNKALYP